MFEKEKMKGQSPVYELFSYLFSMTGRHNHASNWYLELLAEVRREERSEGWWLG